MQGFWIEKGGRKAFSALVKNTIYVCLEEFRRGYLGGYFPPYRSSSPLGNRQGAVVNEDSTCYRSGEVAGEVCNFESGTFHSHLI